jgi:hypothetical protein
MTRIIAKLFAVTVIFTAFLHVAPLLAAEIPAAFVANNGPGNPPCSSAMPCSLIGPAIGAVDDGGEVICFDSTSFVSGGMFISHSVTIDCPGEFVVINVENFAGFILSGTNQVVKIRNLTMSGTEAECCGQFSAIKVTGSGTLILENCVFENFSFGTTLDIEPNGPFNLVIKNSRISNSAAGVVIKPASGGGVTATFNGVTIAGNTGGGMKTDTTNGLVSVDISNSTITNNAGNGLNAVSGAGGANILNIHNSVIARNGTAGVQANGANAAALIDMTLLDSNASGALTTINGGRILTYGNNRIVGSAGSGFTGPTPLQ